MQHPVSATRSSGAATTAARALKATSRGPTSPRCSRAAFQHQQQRRPARGSALRVAAAAAVSAAPEAPTLPFRVGHGWDLHRLEEGYPLIVGGVQIPHTVGCVAHSDGDVLLHTVVDAILGALCLPDIGQLFPDNDPKWKGARSDVFLKEAVRLMQERGYAIGNIDCTIIAERPKMSPHKETIRDNLCQLLGAHPSVVNIKAKTHEKVDSLGENRSIACHAVVMLLRQ
ncbi:hypothetical protein D9Q98_004524 [Chlorella vulgaris]|uniref:2-C-methyl-D-erythritol 2,4-cyclodiphosphate synthase n=1 Tax=Chlorella vulgaris TaxID=3077 RepID=A0A9D4TPS5_CHLVU|nr:hypothetical protein D9Q98_004524 [Chlorella vulgaris]